LEARWAVFFDTIGYEWHYEPEGFQLDNDEYYLPDFWLPKHEAWVEVKGGPVGRLSAKDARRGRLFASSVWPKGQRYRVLGNIPERPDFKRVTGSPVSDAAAKELLAELTVTVDSGFGELVDMCTPDGGIDALTTKAPFRPALHSLLPGKAEIVPVGSPGALGWIVMGWRPGCDAQTLQAALNAGRSARFEHGHSGAS
jgi:hypothetical protein